MIENENKEIDVAKLGDKALDLKIEYPEIKTKKNLRMLDDTIKKFLEGICGEKCHYFYDKQTHFTEIETLNKNKDKIKQIVDYVVNLNEEALVYNDSDEDEEDSNKKSRNNVLIYNFHRNFSPNEPNGQIVDTLDFKKTYMILQLIEWGVNPFEIRRCLKSNRNNNFNWKKFMEYVMDNKDILWKICYCIECENFCKSMNMIRAMYLFEPLFKNDGNTNENLKPCEVGFLSKNLSGFFYGYPDGMHFILNYLNELEDTEQNNKMKEYLLKIPNGYLWKNFLLDDNYNKENIAKVVGEKKDTQINLSNLIVDNVRFDFDEKDFEVDQDFWTLISNLNDNPVLISFFTLVAIRNISLTERQMNFIASRIKNQTVMDKLRKINQNLDYKAREYTHQYNLTRRVKFGPVTAFLDYIFLKMSRGIGYLGAALRDGVLCIPSIIIGGGIFFGAVFLIFLELAALWTITFWIIASIFSGAGALFFVCCFIYLYRYDLRARFAKFADGMEEFYNKRKIVYWLESYNIKHPINEIGEPPAQINTGLQPNHQETSLNIKKDLKKQEEVKKENNYENEKPEKAIGTEEIKLNDIKNQ